MDQSEIREKSTLIENLKTLGKQGGAKATYLARR
jgi:hypothetical protein